MQFAYLYLKFLLIFNDTKVFSSLNMEEILKSQFSIEFLQFFATVLIIHILFASAVISLSRIFRTIKTIRPGILNIVYFLIFYFYLILIHSYLFPNSDFSINRVSSYTFIITILVSAFIIYSLNRQQAIVIIRSSFIIFHKKIKTYPKAIIFFLLILCTSLLFVFTDLNNPYVTIKSSNKPNIIILSIDSLRPDITNPTKPNISPAPFISNQLASSYNFNQAYTPLARTFPSWMSLLTGKQPKNHQAEFNLTDPTRFEKEITLAHILQRNNYHTVYASDEKRFANITKDLGFTEVLGPPYGLADFLLGTFSDLPLLNLVTLIPHAELLLPYSTNNRAAHKNYDPDNFTRYLNKKLENSVETANGKPLFIAIHLCLPHHPFSWRTSQLTESIEDNYLNTVIQADQQLQSIYKKLKSLNAINNNSIQIFMSDHGESLPKDEKTFTKTDGSIKIISGLGHGTNSLQIKQHHIILGIQSSNLSAKNDTQMVSLVDITPTLFGLLPNLNHPPLNFDGINVLDTHSNRLQKRWLSFETGYNVAAVQHAKLDEAEIFKQAAHAYRVTPEGKVVITGKAYKNLLSQKQYTWWDGRYLITHDKGNWQKYNWQDSTVEEISTPLEFQRGLNH